MAKPRLVILSGPPGSGTEVLLKHRDFVHINSDQVRMKYFTDHTFSKEEREKVYAKVHELTIASLQKSQDVLFDGNILSNKQRSKLMSHYAKSAKILFIGFSIPKDVAMQRAINRKRTPDKLYKPLDPARAQNLHTKF